MAAIPTPDRLPVLDLRRLEGSAGESASFLSDLRAAARGLGFFSLSGHGMDQDLVASLRDLSRRCFALPEADKFATAMMNFPHFRGHDRAGLEQTRGRPDRREQIDVGPEKERLSPGPGGPAWARLQGPDPWPAAPAGFRPAVLAYPAAAADLAIRGLRAFAAALEQPESAFAPISAPEPRHLLETIRHPGRMGEDRQAVAPRSREISKMRSSTLAPSRRRGVALAAALCVLGSLGARAASPAEEPVEGGTLNMGLASDTPVIDPSITGSSVTALIARNLVDSLVGQAQDNSFTPWLAERWEVNEDNTLYTFHLRGDVTFSDGTRLDAAAVKANFDRILDPGTTSSYAKSLLGPVDGIEAPDDRTVLIRYRRGFAPLLQGLSLPYLGIQSPASLKAAAGTANTVVGSGPFTLESFVKGQGSRLGRRADYAWGPGYAAHRGPAHIEHIAFRYLPEASVRLGALVSGQLQAIDAVPPTSFRSVLANDRLQVITRENPGVNATLLLNTSKGPFQDVRVRQAFQSATDAAAAVRVAYFGTLEPATNILGPSTLDHDPRVAATWGFDLAKANRLLDEAGWTEKDSDGYRTRGGQRLSVRFVYDSAANPAADVTLAQAVQFQVRQAGFELRLDPVDAGGYTSRTNADDYDIAFLYYVRAEPDILRTVFHSAFMPPNGANYARVGALDDRLVAAVGAGAAERRRLYGEIQAEIVGQAYAVPLYVAAYQLGAAKALHGITWATNAKPNFYDAWLGR